MGGDNGPRSSFGEFLRERGVVTAAQVEEATHSQTVYGGRVGTNLIELGYLPLEEVAVELCGYHSVEQPPSGWLEDPESKAIKIVPTVLLRRHKMLPMRLEQDLIHVAMLDPTDAEQLDFLATAASRPVRAYVLPEVKLLYWLEVHLRIDRHPRFVNLAARLLRTSMRIEPCESGEQTPTVRAPLSGGEPEPQVPAQMGGGLIDVWFDRPGGGSNDVDGGAEELLLEELVLETEIQQPSSLKASSLRGRPEGSLQVAELEATLEGATDRDQIVDLVLRLASTHCEVAVMFLVQANKVTPFRGVGGDIESRMAGLEVPLDVHSIFARPAVTGAPFRGSPPDGGIDGRILSALDRADVQELLVQPVAIRHRVVNLLYCDNGSGALAETSVAALGAVAECAARAYERLILDRKGQQATSGRTLR